MIIMTFIKTGRGDLVGSDLDHQVNNPHQTVSIRSGYDVKALTYCELKAIEIESLNEVRISSNISNS